MKKMAEMDWIHPSWDIPNKVRSLVTTRFDGASEGIYASLNLGMHVGDNPDHVLQNRQILKAAIGAKPVWLNQVHGSDTIIIDENTEDHLDADAAITSTPGVACAVMLADCLPILLCDRGASMVAAVHAGWKGLARGVIEETVAKMGLSPTRLMAYLGPSIGQSCFSVKSDVRAAFLSLDKANDRFFKPSEEAGKWYADLSGLAEKKLVDLGISSIDIADRCTVCDCHFFSYRREGVTGRFAALIWIEK